MFILLRLRFQYFLCGALENLNTQDSWVPSFCTRNFFTYIVHNIYSGCSTSQIASTANRNIMLYNQNGKHCLMAIEMSLQYS